jgi:nitrite reductase/ring-hydroxylating ferredoxin subunit
MGVSVKVAEKKDLPAGSAIAVDVNGKKIAVFNVKGQYYAIDDECTHAGGPLSEGEVEGTVVTCPWHGGKFNITNGEVLGEPAPEGVKSYKVLLEGEDIKIEG